MAKVWFWDGGKIDEGGELKKGMNEMKKRMEKMKELRRDAMPRKLARRVYKLHSSTYSDLEYMIHTFHMLAKQTRRKFDEEVEN